MIAAEQSVTSETQDSVKSEADVPVFASPAELHRQQEAVKSESSAKMKSELEAMTARIRRQVAARFQNDAPSASSE